MPIYTDEDGNEIEVEVSLDQVKELQEKAQKTEEYEKTLEEKETELAKLRDKSNNYTKLNFKNKKELEERTADWSEREKMLRDEISSLQEHNELSKNATVGKAKDELLTQLAGGDEKMKERIENEFNLLGGESALTPDQVQNTMEKAALIVEHDINKSVNPVNAYQPSSIGSGMPSNKKTNFADTDKGKEVATSLGLEIEPPKK